MNPAGAELPYRPCVGIMVFNRTGRVWVGRRIESPGVTGQPPWQMPQGGIDRGEAPEAAALRELYEETSIRSITICAQSRNWLKYDLPKPLLGKALKGRFRGQTQAWFLASFDGEDAEIDVEEPGGGQYEAEFSAWKWVELDELIRRIVPFKRAVYEAVLKEFGPLIEVATRQR